MNLSFNFEKAAACLLTLALFLLSLWRFGANQCIALLILMVFCYSPWRKAFFSWRTLRLPVVSLALIFFVLCLVSVFYSEAPTFVKALQGVKLYSKLLFLLIIPICVCSIKYRRWFENGLIYGTLINVILSTLFYYHIPIIAQYLQPHMYRDITFAINPLEVIYLVVMVIWLLLMRIFQEKWRFVDGIILILLMGYLWLINLERSGYVLFVVLLLLLLYQHFGKKAFLTGCVLLPLLLLSLYSLSPKLKARVDLGIHNLVAFQEAANVTDIGVDNSWGLRLAYAKESFDIMKHRPFFGIGAGSFHEVYGKTYPAQQQQVKINDPDNQYVFVSVELGLVGLLVYLAWLYSIWRFSTRLSLPQKHLFRGIWLIFVIMGLSDSDLILNAIGMSLVIWVSLALHSQYHVDCK